MKNYFQRLFSILSFNTLIALLIAIASTAICIHYEWKMDFPLTIIGIAVVFPIVFSIGGAYNRRESALVQYGIMKSMGRAIFLASRDWLRDDDEKAYKNLENFKSHTYNIFTLCVLLFQNSKNEHFSDEEKAIYREFSNISKSIEDLRDRGLSGSEVSRVNAYLSKFITAFETLKHIYQYRTPRTLRLYSKIFIYIILIVLGPYFSLLAEDKSLWLGLITPILFAMVFTGLDNIQEHLENPFDQIGEDDIKINPEKFIQTLESKIID
ncbi:MAG: bestrophin family ion channel [Pseudomonadota bacterium]